MPDFRTSAAPKAARCKPKAFIFRGIFGHRRTTDFARDEDGAMIIFGIFIFGLMLAIGGLSFDLMRYEAHRERLQATLDRAVLAAASLTQTLDPKSVVLDYFAKAGMSQYIEGSDIVVTEGLNSRRVEAKARINVPLHFGNFGSFGSGEADTLIAEANSVAEESVGNVEISMILDVSGSMNSYNRLTNLKSAAKSFLDTIYDVSEPFAVSTSIVPYATQVYAGETLLSYFNRSDSHPYSYCVNFTTAQFSETSMYDYLDPSLNPASTPLEQTVDFDPWTSENTSFDLGDRIPYPVCPIDANKDDTPDREILAWSTNKATLKDYVDGLVATGNTSTDIGTKWGAALLDPSLQPVLSGMVGSGNVVSELDGRPFNYNEGDSMKVLVVMTDGAHTNQYYMNDYRSGPSFVWRYVENGVINYSIWYDANNSEPITNPSGNYTYCDDWNNGSCDRWRTGSNPKFWFRAFSDDGIRNTYDWRSTPYGGNDATQMDWSQVWSEIPPEYFSDEVLYRMGSLNSTERNAYEYAMKSVGGSTKNARFDALCQAAKDKNVIIFAVGLEVTSSNGDRLRNCASTPSHYYDVDGLDIGYAFQNIASQINQLRLTQ